MRRLAVSWVAQQVAVEGGNLYYLHMAVSGGIEA